MTRQLIKFTPLPRLVVINCKTFQHRVFFGRMPLFDHTFTCVVPPEAIEIYRTDTAAFVERLSKEG